MLGGGKLIASLLEFDLVDELWLTTCALILATVLTSSFMWAVYTIDH